MPRWPKKPDKLDKRDKDFSNPLHKLTCVIGMLRKELAEAMSVLSTLCNKTDLKEVHMKLSELTGTATKIQAQVRKVFTEQQSLHDKLVEKIADLEKQIVEQDPEVPEAITTSLDDAKNLLQQWDDTIPDVEEPPTPA